MSLRSSQRQPVLLPGSIDAVSDVPRVTFEESAGGTRVLLDFAAVAEVIDAVAGHKPGRLSTQLAILWGGDFKEEARYVMTAVLVCRDPLSELGTLCTDALATLADLDKLIRIPRWTSLVSAVGHPQPHACALLNACDDRVGRLSSGKQLPYKAIRTRLERAAACERTARSAEIQALQGLRQARCPGMWQLFERYRDTE